MSLSREGTVPVPASDEFTPNPDSVVRLLHDRVLGRRLFVHAALRYALISLLLSGAVIGRYVAGITDLQITYCAGLVAAMVVWNTAIFILALPFRNSQRPILPHRLLTGLMHSTICMDFLFLTVLLWIVGGAKSPLKAFYLVHVFLAALLLGPRVAYGHALFGFSLLAGLILGQWWGLIPVLLPVGAVNSAQPLNGHYVITVLVVQGTMMFVSAYLVSGLTQMLQAGEAQLSQANAELSRLSQLRRAFLHTALHDLKAPFDAITMMMHNLETGAGGALTEQQAKWVDRCHLRLDEISAFLRDFQIIASLDSVALERESREVDIAAMLRHLVRENEDLAQERMHDIALNVSDSLPPAIGIERLLHEAVANLITNAIKYTPLGGRIAVQASSTDNVVRIEVSDNGVGIAPDDQGKVFQEFVRFRQRSEQTGKVPGSGLGLSIVRRIVELHHGAVGLISELNKGSTFFITLPSRRAERMNDSTRRLEEPLQTSSTGAP